MSIFFEKKLEADSIVRFMTKIFDIAYNEIKVFEQDYFFENGYLEVDDDLKCLCVYRYLKGNVRTIVDIYRIDNQSPEIIIEKLKNFFISNNWDGNIYVENINDYLCFNNNSVQISYINDDDIENDEVYFINGSKCGK